MENIFGATEAWQGSGGNRTKSFALPIFGAPPGDTFHLSRARGADDLRFTPDKGHDTAPARGPLSADFVAKVG